MRFLRGTLGLLVVGVAIAGAIVSSCSDSNSPSGPGGGGGLEINSGNVPPGGVYQHVFAGTGTFPYHCTIHPVMTGNSVTVSASSSNDSALVQIVSSSAPGFDPSSVTIKPGGHVRWINVHTVTHTVTSGN